MKGLFRKPRIFREQVKDRHTGHWDLDMLSKEELDALMTPRKENGQLASAAAKKIESKG